MATAATAGDLYRGHDPRELPAYSAIEAARYIRVPEKTIRAWSFGRSFRSRSGNRHTEPLIMPADRPRCLLSFNNLIELYTISALRREHEVLMAKIRDTVEYLIDHLGHERPLLTEAMLTDGVDLFVEYADEIITASKWGQLAIRAVVEAYLRRVERDPRGFPIRFFPFPTKATASPPDRLEHATDPPRPVTIDPRVVFGRPVITGSRIPTAELFSRFQMGDTISDLAADYDREPSEIEAAIRWEATAAA